LTDDGTMFAPYDDVLGMHPQAEGFTDHQVWDFATTADQDGERG
jgi:alpha,alpha-trehalose phosphorylase